jgi:hypothetical protein
MIYHIIFNKNLNILVHKYNCLIEESLKIPRRYSEAGISKDKRDIGRPRQNTERQTTEDWPTETPLIMGWGCLEGWVVSPPLVSPVVLLLNDHDIICYGNHVGH